MGGRKLEREHCEKKAVTLREKGSNSVRQRERLSK